MKCPHCSNPGELQLVHVRCAPPAVSGWRHQPCRTCDGTNQINDEYGRRLTVGQTLRQSRVARIESLRENAKKLGVSPVTLSCVEFGYLATPDEFRLWNRLTGENLDPFSSARGRCE
jgi:hypothetical protein